MRRLRQHPAWRRMLSETQLTSADLIQPIFVQYGHDVVQPIASMPGQYRYSVDQLEPMAMRLLGAEIPAVILFGVPPYKDETGSAAREKHGVVQSAIRMLHQCAPQLLVIADLCYCEYTHHGHCGLWRDGDVDNDATLTLLAEQAVSLAQAGADAIAPSGMMDGVVAAVRCALDQAHFESVPVLSYAVKYCSNLYGPFRDAAQGKMQFGDRSTYQMNPCNAQEALQEAELDVREGADLLMVKPAHTYLDIIHRVKSAFPTVPLIGYHTSGECALIQSAADGGRVDELEVVLEILTSIKRAGANAVISYYSLAMAEWLK